MDQLAVPKLAITPRITHEGGVLPRLLASVLALVLFAGFGSVLSGIFGFAVEGAALAASFACGAASIVLVALLCGRGRTERIGYIVFFAVLLLSCVLFKDRLAGTAAYAFNSLLLKLGAYTQEYPLSYSQSGDAALFCAALSLMLGFLCALFTFKGNTVLCVCLTAFAALLCITGLVDAGVWIVLVAAGLIGTLLANTTQRALGAKGPAYSSALAVLLVCLVVLGGAAVLVTRSGLVDTSALRSGVERLVYSLRYGSGAYAMPLGQLQNLGELSLSEQPALSVTTQAQTREYLRGFTGELYDGQSWQALGGETVMADEALFYWLGQDGFSAAGQLSLCAAASGYDGAEMGEMTLRYLSARGGYAYLPYAYSSGASFTEATDLSFAKAESDDGEELHISFGTSLTQRAYLLQQSAVEAQDGGATGTGEGAAGTSDATASSGNDAAQGASTYFDDERAYAQFAYDNYLSIPTNVAETFEELYGQSAQLSTEQAKLQVLSNLDQTVAYAADFATDNGDEDFVEHFLTTSQTGYSVHYATAAALMMRYYGIPARYVEGYLLDTTGDDEAASDADSQEAGGTQEVQLTEQDAHAWVEYYLDGVGWIPFEVTPGYRDEAYYEASDDAQLIEDAQSLSTGDSNADSPWSPQEQTEQQEEGDDEQTVQFGKLGFQVNWLMFAIGLALSLLIAFIVRERLLQGRLRAAIARNSSEQTPSDVGTSWLFAYCVMLISKCAGTEMENLPFAAQAQTAAASGVCTQEGFMNAARANDAALFSNGSCTEQDRAAAASLAAEIKEGLKENTGFMRRFWQRRVRCLW